MKRFGLVNAHTKHVPYLLTIVLKKCSAFSMHGDASIIHKSTFSRLHQVTKAKVIYQKIY